MLNWMFFCSFVFSLAMTIVGLLMDLTYQIQLAPQVKELQDRQQKNLSHYLELRSKVSTHPVFNPKLEQGEDFQNLWEELTKNKKQGQLLSLNEKKLIMAMGRNWLEQKHKIELPPSTVLLFKNIDTYTHWHPTKTLNTWDASDLIVSGQLYLAHTFHFEPLNIKESLRRVRHLSLILLSMDYLNFKRAGLSLLEKELTLFQALNEKVLDSEMLWAPISLAELRYYRLYLKNTLDMLSFLSSPTLLNQIYLEDITPIGFCSIIREKFKSLQWSEYYLTKQFPFEPNFKKTAETINKIKNKGISSCSVDPTSNMIVKNDWVSHIPYYRRLYAIKTLLAPKKGEEIL